MFDSCDEIQSGGAIGNTYGKNNCSGIPNFTNTFFQLHNIYVYDFVLSCYF